MAGPGDPPGGTPDNSPGGDDDFPSVVFDDAFVEAARIREYSARERMEDTEQGAVHRPEAKPGGGDDSAPPPAVDTEWPGGGGFRSRLKASKQGIVLVLLIVTAFATAIYMGIRTPHTSPSPAQPMRTALLPLAPRDVVPSGSPQELYEDSPAAQFRTGAEGVTMPAPRKTAHFTDSQVLSALTTAKSYVVNSSIDPDVLRSGSVRSVRSLLDPQQYPQFDRSLQRPRNDGRHAATGWMIRFDPERVELADPGVRVNGQLRVREVAGNALEVTADHVFVYAVRPSGEKKEDGASLFVVRREVHFHFDRKDLRDGRLSVQQVSMRAGPLPCSSDAAGSLTPLLAGERAKDDGAAGTDPYARGRTSESLCGVLASGAQPTPRGR